MLRKVRILFAAVFFVGITLLFLDFTGVLHTWLSWMAGIQFVPALLALNAGVITALVALTLVFGRVYCSVICPLGVFQDVAARLGGIRRKRRYTWSPAMTRLRLAMLCVFGAGLVLSLAAGIGSVVTMIEPYSIYGRIAANVFQPVYITVNNLFAGVAERADSYAFYSREVWLRSLPALVVAVVSLSVVAALAWRGGRTYCNTFCPVGTLLGFLARRSWLKVRIDTSRCVGCGLCARHCKASCIDVRSHSIDYSRCVACGDCMDHCHKDAIIYGRAASGAHVTSGQGAGRGSAAPDKPADEGRRLFLLGSVTAAATAALAEDKVKYDGGLARIEDRVAPARQTPLTPPGSLSAANLASRCTGCQLCVAECPNDVLRPSASLTSLMQPVMSYERGYCRPECTRCSEVCPAGAIRPVTRADKSAIHIGHAVWIRKNCVPVADGKPCGNCASHCPAGAITMVPLDGAGGAEEEQGQGRGEPRRLMIPVVNEELCIGCGACENLCPARPFSAIYVEGHEVHRVK